MRELRSKTPHQSFVFNQEIVWSKMAICCFVLRHCKDRDKTPHHGKRFRQIRSYPSASLRWYKHSTITVQSQAARQAGYSFYHYQPAGQLQTQTWNFPWERQCHLSAIYIAEITWISVFRKLFYDDKPWNIQSSLFIVLLYGLLDLNFNRFNCTGNKNCC